MGTSADNSLPEPTSIQTILETQPHSESLPSSSSRPNSQPSLVRLIQVNVINFKPKNS